MRTFQKLDSTTQRLATLEERLSIHQSLINERMQKYMKARGASDKDIAAISGGICRGLTFLNGYYQFKGKDFFNEIEEAMYIIDHNRFRSNLSNVSYNDLTPEEKKLEHLCNDLLFLFSSYDENRIQQLDFSQSIAIVSGKNAKPFISQFHYDSVFPYNSFGHYHSLVHSLMEIVNVDRNPKFLAIGTLVD